MRNEVKKSIKDIHIIFMGLFIFWSNPAICEDDAYLLELEAESESSQIMETTPAPGEELTEVKEEVSVEGEHRKEFEKRLSQQFPTTFKTYRNLSADEKLIVVDAYFASDKSMPVATRLLFNLYFKLGKHGGK